ncbi:MAG: WG repeat-containing protein [Clostridia bacterium]|nr:WG repeat-containing protein [Clostridia bacterium]
MKNRLFSGMLIFAMILSLFTLTVSSAENFTVIKTDIRADSVANTGGYGSLRIKEEIVNIGSLRKNPRSALLDRNGELLFPYKDTWLRYTYSDGIVSLGYDAYAVRYLTERGKWDSIGFYNLDGSPAFTGDYNATYGFYDGYAFVTELNYDNIKKAHLIDPKGNVVLALDGDFTDPKGIGVPPFYVSTNATAKAGQFRDGLLLCWTEIEKPASSPSEWFNTPPSLSMFYKDITGKTVLSLPPEVYSNSRVFTEGLAGAQSAETGLWGFIDKTGELVIPCLYDDVGLFNDGLATVILNGKHGFINTSGGTVIPFEYDEAFGAAGGLAAVGKDGKFGLVDYGNNVVIPLEYDDISTFDEGVAYAVKNGYVYIIIPDDGSGNPAPGGKIPFTDVPDDAFFYKAVRWAVHNGITGGTTPTTFSPSSTCTRAQIVTFLWRAAGSPRPSGESNPFTDVKEGEYYCDAVLWAVENGITKGTSNTKFSPNQGCSRGQVVTFLYRFEGSPAPQSPANPFSDVVKGEYYYNAVLWAVEKNVTTGISATVFSPNSSCTRGQIVTFLYRDLYEEE